MPIVDLDRRELLFSGSPSSSGLFRSNFSRDLINADNAIGATGLITACAIFLYNGDTITSLSFCVGATAGGTPTNQYAVLYSGATVPLVLGQSTSTGTAAQAANTVITYTYSSTIAITSSGLYWVGVCLTGTTIPTIIGKTTNVNATAAAALNTLLAGTATNGVCVTATGNATTAPATMASITQLAVQPWFLLK